MTVAIENVVEQTSKNRFTTPRELAFTLLVAYVFCLFSTTGAIVTPEIVFKALSLSFLYLAGRNTCNALSGILAASICAAYPHFNTFAGFSLDLISFATISAIMAALSFARFDGSQQTPILFGAALITGVATSLSGISWTPLFLASAAILVVRSPNPRNKTISAILFGLGFGISWLFKALSGNPDFPQREADSETFITLGEFIQSWSLPLFALLLASIASLLFLRKELSSKSEAMTARKTDLGQTALFLLAAIVGAFVSHERDALLIIAPFCVTLGIILSLGLTLFKDRFHSHLGHAAVFFVLLAALLPSDLLESRALIRKANLVFADGIHAEEDWGRWLTDHATGSLYLDPREAPFQLKLKLNSALGTPRKAFLHIDDSLVWSSLIDTASREYTMRLAGISGELEFSLSTPDGCSRPSDVSDSPDDRCLAFGFEGYRLASMRYELGSPISLASGSTRPTFSEYGFFASEDWGAWTDGKQAGFTLELGKRPSSDIVLEVLGHFHVAKTAPHLVVRLLVNEIEVETRTIEDGEHTDPRWIIPSDAIREDGQIDIAWIFENAMSPKDLIMGDDSRKLGLAIRSLTLVKE